ncbi:MAG: RNA polymerase sigma factor, partial [Actinobacteria bacterium]|nr:RNA polymerase sigma factor [Actinomycetota bacterium]
MRTLTTAPPAPLSPPAMALRGLSDERLARWAAKGSQPAFAVIFERHHQALGRYCHSLLGNSHDAADALQNTMLKALRALPGQTRTITLKPWLYRIAHNESISLMRARRDHKDLDTATQLSDPAAHTIAESREQLRDLSADLRELTEQQRATLLMRELAGLQFDDISDALQISATAA